VKILRHQPDVRRTMRTAWELAVTMTLRHPNVVTVSPAHGPVKAPCPVAREISSLHIALQNVLLESFTFEQQRQQLDSKRKAINKFFSGVSGAHRCGCLQKGSSHRPVPTNQCGWRALLSRCYTPAATVR
jgi:hypothetical protein